MVQCETIRGGGDCGDGVHVPSAGGGSCGKLGQMSPYLCIQGMSLGMSLNVGDVVKYDDTNILVLNSNLG